MDEAPSILRNHITHSWSTSRHHQAKHRHQSKYLSHAVASNGAKNLGTSQKDVSTKRRWTDRPHGKRGKTLYNSNVKHNRVREAGARGWPDWCGLLEAAAGQLCFDWSITFSLKIVVSSVWSVKFWIGREIESRVVSKSIKNHCMLPVR